MSSRQVRLQEDTYVRVLRLLQINPDLTQRELAEHLSLSVGAMNYCLKALISKGWLKMQNFGGSKNKFGYIYVLTPKGLSEKAALTRLFLKRKVAEHEAMRAEIELVRVELLRDTGAAEEPTYMQVAESSQP